MHTVSESTQCSDAADRVLTQRNLLTKECTHSRPDRPRIIEIGAVGGEYQLVYSECVRIAYNGAEIARITYRASHECGTRKIAVIIYCNLFMQKVNMFCHTHDSLGRAVEGQLVVDRC